MDFENMSSIKKQLVTAMMLGQFFREAQGLVATEKTKFMDGENEMHCAVLHERLKPGSIITLGDTKENQKNYEILETLVDDDTVILKEVKFFKAKITTGQFISTQCVVAPDMQAATKIIKDYCVNQGYKSILSINPSGFFQPFLK